VINTSYNTHVPITNPLIVLWLLAKLDKMPSSQSTCQYCNQKFKGPGPLKRHQKAENSCKAQRIDAMHSRFHQSMERDLLDPEIDLQDDSQPMVIDSPNVSEPSRTVIGSGSATQLPFGSPQSSHSKGLTTSESRAYKTGTSQSDQEIEIEKFPHPVASKLYKGKTRFSEFSLKQKSYNNIWYPYETEEEWDLAKLLAKSHMSQKDIDSLLKLSIVSNSKPFSLLMHYCGALTTCILCFWYNTSNVLFL
jgi:hypothetical protein